jgi:nitrile hydratase accessory protein
LIAPEAAAFQEPWEAQAFALALTLHDRGAFTWAEWSARLAATIQNAPRSPYYDCWLQALEQLVEEKRLVAPSTLSKRKEAWRRAARATPHGAPIQLENDPLARS